MPKMHDNVLVWGEPEDNTLDQAKQAAAMPFVEGHLALMPDAHWGKGSTIGSVIPTRGAIIPAAVGVDIGCVDAETEFLSPGGWVPISEWAGERVMQYHPETGYGDWVKPIHYVVRPETSFLQFSTKYGIDQRLTADHRVLGWRIVGRDRRREQVVIAAGDLASEYARLRLGAKVEIETSFTPAVETALPFDDDQIRVQVMVSADASIDRRNGRAILHLKKARKIERAEKLLDAAGIDYTLRPQGDGTVNFRFRPPSILKGYHYGWWRASLAQLAVVADECLEWDGNREDRCFYTRHRASADFIQYAFTATGHRSVVRADERDGVIDYRVHAHTETRTGFAGSPKTEVETVPSTDGQAYCFTVPSGFLVLRRNGKIFTTGNCGMCAVETTLTSGDLPDNLDALHTEISRRVPAGVGPRGGHGTPETGPEAESTVAAMGAFAGLIEMMPARSNAIHALLPKGLDQFGTLGAGNHFIEICLDETDRVWLMLHSGSRGLGHTVASQHIKVAQALCDQWYVPLDDPDLAYLPVGTEEFGAYMDDLEWAQRYAYWNRARMMDEVLAALAVTLGIDLVPAGARLEADRINTHHNYVAWENHHGKNIMVTRKGAIRAREGDRGIIPGSMATGSMIVTGLGNPASYDSCSHGAGRRMSRAKARAAVTVEELTAQMGDRAWNRDQARQLRDESPAAYKDIGSVMAAQADLVRVDHTLTSVLNFKGTG